MMDKSILHGKEHRKPYYRSKAFDTTCRNHGSCPHCKNNRLHSGVKDLQSTVGQEDEFFGYWFCEDPSDALNDIEEEQYKTLGSDRMEAEIEWEQREELSGQ